MITDGRTIINRIGRGEGACDVVVAIDGAGVCRIDTGGHIAVNTPRGAGMSLSGECPERGGDWRGAMRRTTGRDWRCECGAWRDVYAGEAPDGRRLRMFARLERPPQIVYGATCDDCGENVLRDNPIFRHGLIGRVHYCHAQPFAARRGEV